jgi:hypothetical protein
MNQGFPPQYWPYLFWPLLPDAKRILPPRAGFFGVEYPKPAGAGHLGSERPQPATAGHFGA